METYLYLSQKKLTFYNHFCNFVKIQIFIDYLTDYAHPLFLSPNFEIKKDIYSLYSFWIIRLNHFKEFIFNLYPLAKLFTTSVKFCNFYSLSKEGYAAKLISL